MIEEHTDVHQVDMTDFGIQQIIFADYISLPDLQAALEKLNQQIDHQRKETEKILVLADVTRLQQVSMNARKFGVQWLRQKRFIKLAAVCHSVYIKHFVQMLIVATGLRNEMKVFNDRKQAMEWLTS